MLSQNKPFQAALTSISSVREDGARVAAFNDFNLDLLDGLDLVCRLYSLS